MTFLTICTSDYQRGSFRLPKAHTDATIDLRWKSQLSPTGLQGWQYPNTPIPHPFFWGLVTLNLVCVSSIPWPPRTSLYPCSQSVYPGSPGHYPIRQSTGFPRCSAAPAEGRPDDANLHIQLCLSLFVYTHTCNLIGESGETAFLIWKCSNSVIFA
jgi:hypothetical protein